MNEPVKNEIQLFEDQKIRVAWDAEREEWYFSIVDVVTVLTNSTDPTAYWRKLKQRLKAEGNETVTNCHALKMRAADGKNRLTDVADTEQLLRIIQSIPSPKAEPFKLWLAQVGRERIEETIDPELTLHDFRMVRGAQHTNLIFDLVIPYSLVGKQAELKHRIDARVQQEDRKYYTVITFDEPVCRS